MNVRNFTGVLYLCTSFTCGAREARDVTSWHMPQMHARGAWGLCHTCVWWVALRQDEMLEVDDANSLGAQPAVRHGADVVLRRQGLEYRDSEYQVLRFRRHHLQAPESRRWAGSVRQEASYGRQHHRWPTCFFWSRKYSEWYMWSLTGSSTQSHQGSPTEPWTWQKMKGKDDITCQLRADFWNRTGRTRRTYADYSTIPSSWPSIARA